MRTCGIVQMLPLLALLLENDLSRHAIARSNWNAQETQERMQCTTCIPEVQRLIT
jgi:hypothetical protein